MRVGVEGLLSVVLGLQLGLCDRVIAEESHGELVKKMTINPCNELMNLVDSLK